MEFNVWWVRTFIIGRDHRQIRDEGIGKVCPLLFSLPLRPLALPLYYCGISKGGVQAYMGKVKEKLKEDEKASGNRIPGTRGISTIRLVSHFRIANSQYMESPDLTRLLVHPSPQAL